MSEAKREGIVEEELDQVSGGMGVLLTGLQKQKVEISEWFFKCPICHTKISQAGINSREGLRAALQAHKQIGTCAFDIEAVMNQIPKTTYFED